MKVNTVIGFLILIILMFNIITPVVCAQYADSTGDMDSVSRFVMDRGIFGIAYKAVTLPFKVIEAIIFGRTGINGLGDYFKIDRMFAPKNPKY